MGELCRGRRGAIQRSTSNTHHVGGKMRRGLAVSIVGINQDVEQVIEGRAGREGGQAAHERDEVRRPARHDGELGGQGFQFRVGLRERAGGQAEQQRED